MSKTATKHKKASTQKQDPLFGSCEPTSLPEAAPTRGQKTRSRGGGLISLTMAAEVIERAATPQDATFKGATFVVASKKAIIRNKADNWNPIKYKAGDADLPKKVVNGVEVPDTSFIGKSKIIPEGTLVQVEDVFIEKAAKTSANDILRYVFATGYGWTHVDNLKDGLKNHSVGVLEAIKPISTAEGYFTVALEKAVVLTPGKRYITFSNLGTIPLGSIVSLESTFEGYFESNKKQKIAKVQHGALSVFTSAGNLAANAHDQTKPALRKIVDTNAYQRQEIDSFIPDPTKSPMFLGKFLMGGRQVRAGSQDYLEVFDVVKSEGVYNKGSFIGWTNLLNLIPGLHTDLRGINAKWSQVVPDERYDREKGKNPEGTAKFVGNDDMIRVVDSMGQVEVVSQLIWPKLFDMLMAANADGQSLLINTGFRHWAYQQALINEGFQANPVGYSTHQIGTAVDLNNKNDIKKGGINWWMERNAYRFGFVRTYQKFAEGHHWEYRPDKVVPPTIVNINGKPYKKYTFASFVSDSTDIWDRSYVLDKQ